MATNTTDTFHLGTTGEWETGFGIGDNGDPINIASASAAILGSYNTGTGLNFLADITYESNYGSSIDFAEDNISPFFGEPQADVTYDLGSGPVTSGIDTIIYVNVEVFDELGGSYGTVNMLALRLDNGATFLNPRGGTQTFWSGVSQVSRIDVIAVTSVAVATEVLPNPNISGGSIEIVCFARGTLIDTAEGMRPIEELRAGDMVLTSDDGAKPIRWIGSQKIGPAQLRANLKLYPVRICAGALGLGLPARDLVVSRQHRMLVRSPIVRRMFGEDEVLIPAIKLTQLPGIYIDESVETVEYFHFLFDKHEVVFAEGAPSESLHTGPQALKALSTESREEITTLFPEIATHDYTAESARRIPPGRRQKRLVERHMSKGPKYPAIWAGSGV